MTSIELIVENKNGKSVTRNYFDQFPVSVGRNEKSHVILKGWSIQQDHCKFFTEKNRIFLLPLAKATCLVNNYPILEKTSLESGDRIKIGNYYLEIHLSTQKQIKIEPTQCQQKDSEPVLKSNENQSHWHSLIHKQLLSTIDLRRIHIDEMGDDQLRKQTDILLDEIIKNQTEIPLDVNILQLKRDVINEAIGLGPLEQLLERNDVTEIMVNAADIIFYESEGQLIRSDITFSNSQALMAAIERIVLPLGRRIDEASPMVDARLPDGSRVNAIIPPLALKGPCLTIRKFSKERLLAPDLVKFGALNDSMSQFLQQIVSNKQNIIISGGTGSGKTTLLNVLSSFIPENERIITIEDAAELQLHQPNLVSLESKPANQEGKGQIQIRDLVKNSLRMRPDRIVIGECRGGETLDMLQAMNTGHDGSLTTAHANSPRDCLSRVEVMVLMAGMDLPITAIREQITSAINYVIQQTRFPCGSRKITAISEIGGLENGVIQLTDIFRFQQNGYSANGKIKGEFVATGIVPEFVDQQRKQGIEFDTSIFMINGEY